MLKNSKEKSLFDKEKTLYLRCVLFKTKSKVVNRMKIKKN